MAKKILLTALKGGVGVTTCCVGLGRAFAASGEKTLIVDGDYSSGCAATVAGCANLQVFSMNDYKQGNCRAKQLLITHLHYPNFYLLSALGCNDEETLIRAVLEVEGLFDVILFDKCAKKLCDFALVISEPFETSVKSADVCISQLSDAGIKNVSLILNKVNGGLLYNGEIMPHSEIAYLLHVPLKAVIPEDINLPLGKSKNETFKAFNLAAMAILEKKDKIYPITKGYSGINGFFKRKLRSIL